MCSYLPRLILLTGLAISFSAQRGFASDYTYSTPSHQSSAQVRSSLEAFTAKVERERVRLRTKPHLGASVIKEMGKGDLLVVRDEEDEFYAVEPPSDMEGYVYRTFVLDGVIEGSNVNVRLGPGTDHAIIAQLNTGDEVKGSVARENTKWLKIKLPHSARFFIAKEYLSKVGGPEYLSQKEAKHSQLSELFQEACTFSNRELEKSFVEIDFDEVRNRYQHIIDNYSEFKSDVDNAKDLLLLAQDAYLQKKINFLEEKAQQSEHLIAKSSLTSYENRELEDYQETTDDSIARSPYRDRDSRAPTTAYDDSYSVEFVSTPRSSPKAPESYSASPRTEAMMAWDEVEEEYFVSWKVKTGIQDRQSFHRDEELSAVRLKGIIEPYHRPVKNKPGNYVLRNTQTQLPEAYLYSTKVDLQAVVGQDVTLIVTERPNNHFAFPAYFVLSCE